MNQLLNFIKNNILDELMFLKEINTLLSDPSDLISFSKGRTLCIDLFNQAKKEDKKNKKIIFEKTFNGKSFDKWEINDNFECLSLNIEISKDFLKKIRIILNESYPILEEEHFLQNLKNKKNGIINSIITMDQDIRLNLISFFDKEKEEICVFRTNNNVLAETLYEFNERIFDYNEFELKHKNKLRESLYEKI